MIYDTAIVGLGCAGVFAAHQIAKNNKNSKILCLDMSKKWAKRKNQLLGWMGAFPGSDAKLYYNDLSNLLELLPPKKIKVAHKLFNKIISNVSDLDLIKDKGPSIALDKKIKKSGYNIIKNDYVQLYPKDIHALSKYIAEIVENNENMTFSFDNEVKAIHKQKGTFTLTTEGGEFKCKKLLICVGRAGWRWAKEIYTKFGIVENNDYSKFGIRVEMNSQYMKDFNKSNCLLTKEGIEIGPFSWYGTVIPEDHYDVAISSFRSNEPRWYTDKVSFNLIGNRNFPNYGIEQTDRLAKLTFILANDRIIKERTSYIMNGKSKISILPEYNWIKEELQNLTAIIPEITTKAYFHVPTIIPTIPKINISKSLETDIDGMYVAGESCGINGILVAALTGIIAAESICK